MAQEQIQRVEAGGSLQQRQDNELPMVSIQTMDNLKTYIRIDRKYMRLSQHFFSYTFMQSSTIHLSKTTSLGYAIMKHM